MSKIMKKIHKENLNFHVHFCMTFYDHNFPYVVRHFNFKNSFGFAHMRFIFNARYRIGGVMGSVFASSAVDRGFEPRSGLHKDYAIGICCFSAKHVALRRKGKDWLAWNQNNVSEWSDMFTRKLLFQ
jgi:hypothetical protein